MASHDLFLAHRDDIERALASICRRQHLTGADAEDFCAGVRLHLLENDCGVIRRFGGRSSIRTYLVTVAANFFQDWRNARWGKWRPSAEARRLGPVAVQLETLLVRDRMPFDAACVWLETHAKVTLSRAELEALAGRFPHRVRRSFVSDDELPAVAAPVTPQDTALIEAESAERASRVARLLRAALDDLPHEDRLIIRLITEDGLSIADVSRALGLEQKPLYRRIDRLLAVLRRRLESEGLSATTVGELLAARAFDREASQHREIGRRFRLFTRERAPVAKGETL